MKKSLLAFVLAFSLVLSVAVPAFAATPADVVGKPEQSAVEELIALGVIQGYEDGTFKPENDITRAELAKIIVIASGNGAAANLMANVKPSFKDVKAGVWYTGYINAAAAKGFIQGYNGNFRPSDNVKFEEVVAMLVRALGYKESQLSGAWPYNYLLAAQDTQDSSLFEGLDITPGTVANRGIVAKLASNTINAKQVTYTGINGDVIQYGEKLVTKIGETTKAVVSASALDGDKKISLNGALVSTADNFVVTGGKALADLVGHTVTVIKTKDGSKVLAVTDAQTADKIVAIENDATADTVGYNTYIVDKNSKSYATVASDKYLGYQNNFVTQTIPASLAASAKATLFLDAAGNVQFVSIVSYTENKLVTGFDAKTSFRDARVNYATNASVSVKDSSVVKLNGKLASAADLKENDVIRFVLSGTSAVILEATRETVTGKIEQVKVEGGKYYYTVSGKVYEDLNTIAANALTLNSEYTLFLNKDGKVAGSKAASANTSSNYAVAIKDQVGPVAIIDNGEVTLAEYIKLELFSAKENKNIVVYLKAADITGGTVSDNTIVKLTYNADGKVTKAAVQTATAAAGPTVKDVTATTITTTTNSTYYVNSNTVYLDASMRSGDTISVATAAQVTKNDQIAVILNSTDLVTAELVVLVTDSDATNTDTTVRGTFVSKYTVASGSTVNYFVKLNVKGAEQEIAVTSAGYNDVTATNKFELVTLTDLVGGKYDTGSNAVAAATTLSNVTTSNSTFTANTVDYIVTPNTVVYAVDKDNKVSVDTFGAITAVDGGTIGTDFDIYVVATGNTVSTFNEAAVVVVKSKK